MAKVEIFSIDRSSVGTLDLDDSVFQADAKPVLLHQVLVAYRANQRQGNAQTRGRSEIRGGGKKPYRQKGTGRARQGSIRAPHYRGGGTQFGPQKRSYRQAIPKTMKAEALRQGLTQKLREGKLIVLDRLELAEPKTRLAAGILKKFEIGKSALFLDRAIAGNTLIAFRNIPKVECLSASECSVLDICDMQYLFVTKEAVEELVRRLTKGEVAA